MLQARTEQGLVRPSNQDVAIATRLRDGSRLLVVADGVGGYPGGEVASRTAVDAVQQTLSLRPPSDPAEGLREAFAEAHYRVREGQTGTQSRMSTTLVAALVRGSEAWIANVGDSRGYLVRDARAEQVTLDHSWVEEEIRAGRLEPGDALALINRHLITRSIGGKPELESDTFGPLALTDGSVLLLCTDGLHGVLGDEQIAALIAGSGGDYAGDLVAAVLEGGAPDNVGIALLRHDAAARGAQGER